MDFSIEDSEVLLQGRGTPAERLARIGDAFANLAREGDERAARMILAQLEGKDPKSESDLNGLDVAKVAIIADGLSHVRRGDVWDLVFTAASASAGVIAGYLSHKAVDLRVGGVPVNGAVGAAGMVAGVAVDSTLTTRNVLFAGGSGFAVGSALYALNHPENVASLNLGNG